MASGYHGAIHHCEHYLKEAVHYLLNQQDDQAQKYMTLAQRSMDEANRWFNRANNEKFRTDALVAEIKALRSGQGVSYATGQDPTSDDWRKPEFPTPLTTDAASTGVSNARGPDSV